MFYTINGIDNTSIIAIFNNTLGESLIYKKVLSLLNRERNEESPNLLMHLDGFTDKFKSLCTDFLEKKSKHVGKVSFKKTAEVVKVAKGLKIQDYNNTIFKNIFFHLKFSIVFF